MFELFKRKRKLQQKEQALKWYEEWEKNHPEAVQSLEELNQKVDYIKENNIPLDSLTDEELRDLSTSFSEIGEQALNVLEQRRTTLGTRHINTQT